MFASPWIVMTTVPFIVMNLTAIGAQPINNGGFVESNLPVVPQNQLSPAVSPDSKQQQYSQKLQSPPLVPPPPYYYRPEYAPNLPQPATYYPPEQVKSPQELAAEDATAKRAILVAKVKKASEDVNKTLEELIAGLQQDDDILDKIQGPSKTAGDLLRDLKNNLNSGNLSNSLETLNTLVKTLQAIAASVIEQDDDTRVHDLLLNMDNSTHTLVQDFSALSSSSSSPDDANQEGNPEATLPDLTGLDSAVADKEEP